MRYSVAVKFIAIALTAIALVAAFTGVLGIVQVAQLGLYTDGFDGWIQNRLEWQAYDLAEDLTDRYAVRALTNCPDALLEQLGYWYVFDASIHWTGLTEESYNFNIVDPEGETLASGKVCRIMQSRFYTRRVVLCSILYWLRMKRRSMRPMAQIICAGRRCVQRSIMINR